MKIYVTVGTHEQPFQRLLCAVSDMISTSEDDWFVQYGVGSWSLSSAKVSAAPYLNSEEVVHRLRWADLVITQASPGTVFSALQNQVWPLVLGRQRRFGEHVDDHQLRFAQALSEMGLATDIEDVSMLRERILREKSVSRFERSEYIASAMADSASRSGAFAQQSWEYILGLVS